MDKFISKVTELFKLDNEYVYFVILLQLICIILLILFIMLFAMRGKKNEPLYKKKVKKITFPAEFLSSAKNAYEATQCIQGMLDLLKTTYPKGKIYQRILAAEDYLLYSRYKDFETTLHLYLSDGSEGCRELYNTLISKEVEKRYRLPCK